MAVVCLAKCLPNSHPHLTTVLILEAICQLYILSLDPRALKGDHVLHSTERNVGRNTSVQFTSVSQSCLSLCDPMDCSMPGFPVLQYLPEFAQIHVH